MRIVGGMGALVNPPDGKWANGTCATKVQKRLETCPAKLARSFAQRKSQRTRAAGVLCGFGNKSETVPLNGCAV